MLHWAHCVLATNAYDVCQCRKSMLGCRHRCWDAVNDAGKCLFNGCKDIGETQQLETPNKKTSKENKKEVLIGFFEMLAFPFTPATGVISKEAEELVIGNRRKTITIAIHVRIHTNPLVISLLTYM